MGQNAVTSMTTRTTLTTTNTVLAKARYLPNVAPVAVLFTPQCTMAMKPSISHSISVLMRVALIRTVGPPVR